MRSNYKISIMSEPVTKEKLTIRSLQSMVDRIRAVVNAGIPCMGHIGMVPQQIRTTGGYRVVGCTAEEAKQVYNDAILLQEAGVWAIEVECVPDRVAEVITKRLRIPTLGTGSGAGCDGQGLMSFDIWGLPQPVAPRLAKKYDDLFTPAIEALKQFKQDVKTRDIVLPDNCLRLSDDEFKRFMEKLS